MRLTSEAPPSERLCIAVALLRQAKGWLFALQRRLAVDSAVATERLDDSADAAEAPAAAARQRDRILAADAGRLLAKPALELMGGICADLTRAAELLGDAAVADYVAKIAAAARALPTGCAAAVLAAWSDVLGPTGQPSTATAIAAPDSG